MKFGLFLLLAGASMVCAQYIGYPTKNVPRDDKGKPKMEAPAPRTADGKVDLSGLWETYNEQGKNPLLLINAAMQNKPGDVVMTPTAQEMYDQRQATAGKDHPGAKCLPSQFPEKNAVPHPFKILQTPDLTVILYESRTIYRQIFTDGRPLPVDPVPAWQGYSVGHWDKDEFVVESSGFQDNGWLDMAGHPSSKDLKITERFVRKDFGHMDIITTITDPKMYVKPWTMTLHAERLVDTELLEYVCEENNVDSPHMIGK